jgi:hypothetical protein
VCVCVCVCVCERERERERVREREREGEKGERSEKVSLAYTSLWVFVSMNRRANIYVFHIFNFFS